MIHSDYSIRISALIVLHMPEIKIEHIALALLAVVALYVLYDIKNESFCPGNDCGVLETSPSFQPKYWLGRDHRRHWGNYYFMDDHRHPSVPNITHYDSMDLSLAAQQRAKVAGGCPTLPPLLEAAPAPQEEQIKAIPLKLNCPKTMDHIWDFQPADFPLLPNLETTTWVKE